MKGKDSLLDSPEKSKEEQKQEEKKTPPITIDKCKTDLMQQYRNMGAISTVILVSYNFLVLTRRALFILCCLLLYISRRQ